MQNTGVRGHLLCEDKHNLKEKNAYFTYVIEAFGLDYSASLKINLERMVVIQCKQNSNLFHYPAILR